MNPSKIILVLGRTVKKTIWNVFNLRFKARAETYRQGIGSDSSFPGGGEADAADPHVERRPVQIRENGQDHLRERRSVGHHGVEDLYCKSTTKIAHLLLYLYIAIIKH